MFSVCLTGLLATECAWLGTLSGHRRKTESLLLGVTVHTSVAVPAGHRAAVLCRTEQRRITATAPELCIPAKKRELAAQGGWEATALLRPTLSNLPSLPGMVTGGGLGRYQAIKEECALRVSTVQRNCFMRESGPTLPSQKKIPTT